MSATDRVKGWTFMGTIHHADPVPTRVPWCVVRNRRGDTFYAGEAAVGLYVPRGYVVLFEIASLLTARSGVLGTLADQIGRVNTLDTRTVARLRFLGAFGLTPAADHWRLLPGRP